VVRTALNVVAAGADAAAADARSSHSFITAFVCFLLRADQTSGETPGCRSICFRSLAVLPSSFLQPVGRRAGSQLASETTNAGFAQFFLRCGLSRRRRISWRWQWRGNLYRHWRRRRGFHHCTDEFRRRRRRRHLQQSLSRAQRKEGKQRLPGLAPRITSPVRLDKLAVIVLDQGAQIESNVIFGPLAPGRNT
jgi:hypothetical protein